MEKDFDGSSPRKYDDDVSKRFGFQSQIQSSNPSSNPNWSGPMDQGARPSPSAPLVPAPAPVSAPVPVPPAPVAATYIGPHYQAAGQLPRRDKLVECARCSICFIMFGGFLLVVGIIMLSTAKNFDVTWQNPPPVNPMRIIGPIALTFGIVLLLAAVIVIVAAKRRVASNPTLMATNYGGPTPVISGRLIENRNDSTAVELSDQRHNVHGSAPQPNHYYQGTADSPPTYDAITTTNTSDHKPY